MARPSSVVSGLGDAGIAIAMPVMSQGQVRYVLGVRLANSLWPRLAAAATLPAGAHARLYDREGRLISQSAGVAPAGARLQGDALNAMLRHPSGVERSTEADGGDVYAAWDRVQLSAWHARVFMPAAPIDAAHRQLIVHTLSTAGAALLAGLLLSVIAAWALYRRVREAMAPIAAPSEAEGESPRVVELRRQRTPSK
jgi:hypothetical protein